MEVKIDEVQSLALVKQDVEAVENQSRFKVTSEDKLQMAVTARKQIKEASKKLEVQKKSITDPLNAALKNTRALFAPFEERLQVVDKWLGGQMLDWMEKKEAEARAKAAEVEKKVATGEITFAKASVAVEKATAKVEAVPVREITKLRIVDASKLPREYLIPDEGKIFAALKGGQLVVGAELYKEKIVVNQRS
jgi:hypothetical protein